MAKTMTTTKTKTQTQTKCLKHPTYALFLKSWWLTHSQYDDSYLTLVIMFTPVTLVSGHPGTCSGHTISSTGPCVSPFRDFFLYWVGFLRLVVIFEWKLAIHLYCSKDRQLFWNKMFWTEVRPQRNYIPRGHFLTDEPTIDNQRENPPKTERILWFLKNQNTFCSCLLT